MRIKNQERIMRAVANYLQAGQPARIFTLADGIDALYGKVEVLPDERFTELCRAHEEIMREEYG